MRRGRCGEWARPRAGAARSRAPNSGSTFIHVLWRKKNARFHMRPRPRARARRVRRDSTLDTRSSRTAFRFVSYFPYYPIQRSARRSGQRGTGSAGDGAVRTRVRVGVRFLICLRWSVCVFGSYAVRYIVQLWLFIPYTPYLYGLREPTLNNNITVYLAFIYLFSVTYPFDDLISD